ncbi:ABC transporter ATP-binding protein [Variovorax boronicumulans]|uniref:ABC transporter ATP-binding protein n=1 Tax=Variovorax boronicumulans TaxID=436515 RepID=UPI001C578E39
MNPHADRTARTSPASRVEFRHISKHFDGVAAVQDVDLVIEPGEFISLLGPSGSGKSTLLMLLAGFERPTHGEILIDGRSMNDVPPNRRDVGIVFQSYALFPRMSVRENVAFPLNARGITGQAQARLIDAALTRVRMTPFADRLPSQLSGGQQQRVALARALVFNPPLVLMDESLSALDRRLRQDMHVELRQIHREIGTTIVFVTHDQEEAMALSDRIVVLQNGAVQQRGTPTEIYTKPVSKAVANFMGESNFIEGTLVDVGAHGFDIATPVGRISFHGRAAPHAGPAMVVAVRPENMRVDPAGSPVDRTDPDGVDFMGEVVHSSFRGNYLYYQVRCDAGLLSANVPFEAHRNALQPGDRARIRFDKTSAMIF